VSELTLFLGYEALRHQRLESREIETPLDTLECGQLRDNVVLLPVLRAGVGMLDAMLTVVPEAKVGFIGLYRDPDTHHPVHYYDRIPEPSPEGDTMVILDPMLATGGSTIAAIEHVKALGYGSIIAISILASRNGLAAVEDACPYVSLTIGALDEKLNAQDYIVPGLGDAGDRLFGT
jgi:uracil phosphoribosyltransferase